ncbi:MAG: glycosyltransferase family 4 protein [Patescibacteria group bacterium]
MRILQITATFFPVIGGQEKVVYEISKRLIKKGYKVDILTSDSLCEDQNLPSVSQLEGIKIIRLKNTKHLAGYGYAPALKKWLKQYERNYDLIHSHGYNRYLSEFAIGFTKLPVVFTPHGFIHTKKNMFFKRLHDKTVGKKIRKCEVCTALTKLDYKDYKRLGVRNDQIWDVPNGVDIEKFKKVDKKLVDKLKKKYKLKNTLLFVGRIHESKGLQYVAEAIKHLDCKLLIIGKDAGFKDKLKSDKIIFGGSLTDKELIAAYHACDVFVLFSEWEGFGIVVIEAGAAKKPVITSDRGSLPYIVKDNGIMVPFKDIKTLREKIQYLLKNKKVAKKMGENGFKIAKNYSWDSVVNKLIKAYQFSLKHGK